MKSYNKVMLMGHLTADPELRSTTTGKAVTTFTLAVSTRGKDGTEYTGFHRLVAWNQTAEFCCRNFKRGMAIFAVGSLMNHSYEGKNGKQYVTEVLVQDVNILTWKGKKPETLEEDPGEPLEPIFEEVDVADELNSVTM